MRSLMQFFRHRVFDDYRWTLWLVLISSSVASAAASPKPAAPQVSVVGLVAKTHAVRHPTPGGFGNTLEFSFVRFLERELANRELTINYGFEWITALPQDFGKGRELLGRQTLFFPVPTAADRSRGYQIATVALQVAAVGDNRARPNELNGQQLRVKVLASLDGQYLIVDDTGRLIPEINRRWAEQSALCRIYEGCVIACLPNDQATSSERHPVDPHDLDQFVPDCYLIAALVAAARCDPDQLRNLISLKSEGYCVTFPGHASIKIPDDLDRGPDMVESRALDVDSQGNVEIWPVLLERGFALLNSQMKPNCSGPGQEFLDVGDGDSRLAYHILTGRPAVDCMRYQYRNRAAQLQAIQQHLDFNKPVMMATGKWTDSGDRPHWWLEDHVYVVTAVGTAGKTLTVIDPSCGQLIERIKIGDWFESTEVKRFLLCE